MTTTLQSPLVNDLSAAWIKESSTKAGEEAWVLELRLRAYAQFEALAWPTEKDERWKRIELKKLNWEKLPLVSSEETISSPWISLQKAFKSNPEEIKFSWESALQRATGNKFMLLNLAAAFTGQFLSVPKNQKLTVTIPTPQATKGSVFHFAFISVEEGAEAQIWEDLENTPTAEGDISSFLSTFTSIHVKPNAKVSLYGLQHWNGQTAHFQFQNIIQEQDSRLNAVAVAVGGRLFRHETAIQLNGVGAENKVLGLLFGDAQQNFENWITQYHTARKTTSDIQYRGALKGSSHSFFSGLVSIVKEAQQSDAYQASKSLLLSKDARADAIPNLEILADDVKCSHGAAVGPVDEDQKYYLQTRGVPPEEAEKIIIQGFFEPVIAEVPSESVQEKLRTFIEEKLNK